MEARLLAAPPISGTISESHFHAVGDCVWIQFDPEDGPPWVASFGKNGGLWQSIAVAVFGDGRSAAVIAGGRAYVVDLESRSVRYLTGEDLLMTVISVPEQQFVIATSYGSLHALGIDRGLWSFGIGGGDIVLDSATATHVVGKVSDHTGRYAFSLRYEGTRLQWGERLSPP